MTDRLGTCKHCFQIQEAYRVGDLPHDKPVRIDSSDHYTCEWLRARHSELPPPIKRQNGGFHLRGSDCNHCPQYTPAADLTGIR